MPDQIAMSSIRADGSVDDQVLGGPQEAAIVEAVEVPDPNEQPDQKTIETEVDVRNAAEDEGASAASPAPGEGGEATVPADLTSEAREARNTTPDKDPDARDASANPDAETR